jgi:peroxiredoxin
VVCRQQVAGLKDAAAAIERRGASIVVISNGPVSAIAGFREATGYPGRILADPGRRAYRGAGLIASLGSVLHPRAIVRTMRALLSGAGIGRERGDALQQGGTFVLGPGEVDRFVWRDRFSGDHAPLERVLGALP